MCERLKRGGAVLLIVVFVLLGLQQPRCRFISSSSATPASKSGMQAASEISTAKDVQAAPNSTAITDVKNNIEARNAESPVSTEPKSLASPATPFPGLADIKAGVCANGLDRCDTKCKKHSNGFMPGERFFTAGNKLRLEDLPPSRLRRQIAALPAAAQENALNTLSTVTFATHDLEEMQAHPGNGAIYYACDMLGGTPHIPPALPLTEIEPGSAMPGSEPAVASRAVDLPPIFHSRPGSPRKLFLDFDGHVVTGTAWNNGTPPVAAFDTTPYSLDGDLDHFSAAEQIEIERIWQRAAEDFAPFDVDVTTEEPAPYDFTQHMRVLITRSTDRNGVTNPAAAVAAGVAFLNAFNFPTDPHLRQPAWVYHNSCGNRDDIIGDVISHEAGHTFSLNHDESMAELYYSGHGSGNVSWAPIMGSSIGRQLTQWSKGEFFESINPEDDLAAIAARLGNRPDDHANSNPASTLILASSGAVSASGLIERDTDVDVFRFTATVSGAVNLTVSPLISASAFTRGGNVDVLAELFDAAGVLIASSNPVDDTIANITADIDAGIHYLRVSGVGANDPLTNGYTDYASLGQFTISGTIPDGGVPQVSLSLSDDALLENGGSITVTANLSVLGQTPVTVNFDFAGTGLNPADYTASATSLIIPVAVQSGTFTLTAVQDNIHEANETIIVGIDSVTNGAEQGTQALTAAIINDDPAPNVTLGLAGSPIAENGGMATITATLANPSSQAVTVALNFGGTAANPADYTRSVTSIVINAGDLTGTCTLTGVNDGNYEGNKTIIVDIDSVTNGAEAGTQRVTAALTDDEAQPSVTLGLSSTPLVENGGAATLTATLSHPSVQTVRVKLGFTGTALRNDDYTDTGDTITIQAGATTGTYMLAVSDDNTHEGDETVVADIIQVTNGTESGTQQVTATITDDDAEPTVTLSLTDSPLNETGSVATITATLSNPSSQTITVDLGFTGSATNVTDYTRSGVSIAINPGETSGTVTLTSAADSIFEADETIVVDIINVTNASESGVQQVTAVITENDPLPTVTLGLAGSPLPESGGGSATVTATLSAICGVDVTVNLGFDGTASHPADFTRTGTSITVAAGNLTGTAMLTVVSDTAFEGNETVVVSIAAVTNGTESGTQQVTASITDDDARPTVTLSLVGNPLTEAGGIATVTATLSNPSVENVTVNLGFTGDAARGTDYEASSSSIVIPAGSISGDVTITSTGDAFDEPDETINVDVLSVTNGTESGAQQVGTTITDDDTLPGAVLSVAGSPFGEAAGVATVTATLSVPAVQVVTVNLGFSGTAGNGADYTPSASSIMIGIGNVTGSITLTANSDTLIEGAETVLVDIASVTNGLEAGTQQISATINDNDPEGAPPVIGSVSFTPAAPIAGDTVTFTVAASDPEGAALTQSFNYNDGASDATGVHVYASAGTYNVVVTISDGVHPGVSTEVTVVVAAPGTAPGAPTGPGDADDDGVSNDNEIIDGTNGLDPNSFIAMPLTVTKLSAKASYKAANADSVGISGTIPNVLTTFKPTGAPVRLTFGGVVQTYTLSAKGSASASNGSFGLKMKFVKNAATKQKEFAGGNVAFSATMKGGSWSDDWADEGLDPAKTMVKQPLPFIVNLRFFGRLYTATVTTQVTSKPGSGASIKK